MSTVQLLLSKAIPRFLSPSNNYLKQMIKLRQIKINNSRDTYYLKAKDCSMKDAGIMSGDLLVIDCARIPKHGDIIIASVDGVYNCKMLDTKNQRLISANPSFPPVKLDSKTSFQIEGVVTYSINDHHVRKY